MKELVFFILLATSIYSNGSDHKRIILNEIKKAVGKDFNVRWVSEKKVPRPKRKVRVEKKEKSTRVDWLSQRQGELNNWGQEKKIEKENWQKKKLLLIKSWSRDRLRFKKDIPRYKKALTKLPVVESKESALQYDLVKVSYREVVIDRAFQNKAKDQGPRSTCAAFAGARALEIKLAQKTGFGVDLSEQYFYWASKPDCQRKDCQRKGSWVLPGFRRSMKAKRPDIPLELDCAYHKKVNEKNETQNPLSPGCSNGQHQLRGFKKLSSTSEILKELEKGNPVVGGLKLSENFYRNKGYVFFNKRGAIGKDEHAKGHALIFIGYLELPKELKEKEGDFCFLVTNSWGPGWGQGGHACLSERWFRHYRYNIPFIAVTKVR